MYKFDILQPNTIDDFICTHDRFENPQFIVDNEHVTLMTVAENYALFAVARDKDMHLWKSEYNSFVRLAYLDYCVQLIVVPREAFHRLSESIGDPKAELIFLINVARCGSTLFGQMMETTGRVVTISEPDAPNQINGWANSYGVDAPGLKEVTRDAIRWTCRPYPSIKPLAYVVKLTASTSHMLHLLKANYPDSK